MAGIPAVALTGGRGVGESSGIELGEAVKLGVAGIGGLAVKSSGAAAGLNDVGANTAEVGVAYCPHSDGVEAHALSSKARRTTGARMRLTRVPPAELYLWGFD